MDIASLLASPESEELERKEAWSDECLKDLAALANTRGGTLLVGVTDDGSRIPGWKGAGKDLERVSNQIVGTLHVHPLSLTVEQHDGQSVLAITMLRAAAPVAVRGRYHRRVGNSTRDVPVEDLPRFLLEHTGQSWDALPSDAGPEALSEEALAGFKALARARLPEMAASDDVERVMDNLRLRTADGRLMRAAVMLFGKGHEPQRAAVSSQVHMGRFKTDTLILDDKMIEGNLFQQLDAVMALFRQYLQVRFEFRKEMGDLSGVEAMQRIEIWDYPLDALREAVANALLHRDYTSTAQIMIRVFDDTVVISNPGGLPEGLTVSDLLGPHSSHPRNPLLAQGFYFASIVERWGSGTTRMADLCRANGLPAPEFESTRHEFKVTFRKDPYTEARLRALGLSDRQLQAVRYVREKGSISNAEFQRFFNVSRRTATRDLAELVGHGLLDQHGEVGQGTRYRMKGA